MRSSLYSYGMLLSLFTLLSVNAHDESHSNRSVQSSNSTQVKKPIVNRIQDSVTSAKEYVTQQWQKFVDNNFKKDKESRIIVMHFHPRLKRWFFNKNFRKNKTRKEILYHTYHPLATYFVEKYGTQSTYHKGNFSGMRYSLDGLVQYPNGRWQNVTFSSTKDRHNTWYHREINFKSSKKLQVSNEPFKAKIKHYTLSRTGELRDIAYFENSSWIKIYDAANDVTLYLKKHEENF